MNRIDGTTARALECTAVFVLLPVAYAFGILSIPKLILLGIVTIFCLATLIHHGLDWTRELRMESLRSFIPLLAIRLGLVGCGAIILTLIITPASLFAFPVERPRLWFTVILLYPLLSALPQEIIYRTFFFKRYAPLFDRGTPMLLASAAAFGFLHIAYGNAIAVLLSLGGGILLGGTYENRHSLAAVWIEHSGYGIILFTVGLGRFFYSG